MGEQIRDRGEVRDYWSRWRLDASEVDWELGNWESLCVGWKRRQCDGVHSGGARGWQIDEMSTGDGARQLLCGASDCDVEVCHSRNEPSPVGEGVDPRERAQCLPEWAL